MTIQEQLKICSRYISKQRNAKDSGIEFSLPLTSFHNIMKAKRCAITGHKLKKVGNSNTWDYLTIDRLDNSLGYIKGNCAAVSRAANEIKGIIENPENGLTPEDLIKIARSMQKHQPSQKKLVKALGQRKIRKTEAGNAFKNGPLAAEMSRVSNF